MKNEIRKKLKEMRNSMTDSEVLSKSALACQAFIESKFYKNAK